MKVKVLRSIGKKDTIRRDKDNPNSPELPCKPDGTMYQENEIVELGSKEAEKLISLGIGESLNENKKV